MHGTRGATGSEGCLLLYSVVGNSLIFPIRSFAFTSQIRSRRPGGAFRSLCRGGRAGVWVLNTLALFGLDRFERFLHLLPDLLSRRSPPCSQPAELVTTDVTAPSVSVFGGGLAGRPGRPDPAALVVRKGGPNYCAFLAKKRAKTAKFPTS